MSNKNLVWYTGNILMAYKTTIGLEVHAELKTQTKMFCRCKNDPDETQPNKNICPVCTAQPGTLPVSKKTPEARATTRETTRSSTTTARGSL